MSRPDLMIFLAISSLNGWPSTIRDAAVLDDFWHRSKAVGDHWPAAAIALIMTTPIPSSPYARHPNVLSCDGTFRSGAGSPSSRLRA
ncbi:MULTISPECIES: hypothetical protein [unclassified Bradyrhizobium]|uniref:hypothetical protein n=1 Tax=unclassified Bradyrhizobium TaxID=2631580 RepID=UPI0020B25FB9|nr:MULTISPECIES: hypothetical protein [unclassified Bradyrhizobium]MCP3401909.1 hypothetical protein [Bradyrhizobium sp. CCGB20]MCP3410394.1 hypothetical protein [Bradyrhizobium sp. CCGB01]